MAAGGKTVAVIGTPLDRCYPAEHAGLQMQLCQEQLVLSQFAPGARVFPANFPQRNRFMALLSHASVIIEAGNTSGSLSQAAETQRLGRPLFIARSLMGRSDLFWPAKFLRAGAHALDDAAQVIDAVA
jgi:DNA processing protein